MKKETSLYIDDSNIFKDNIADIGSCIRIIDTEKRFFNLEEENFKNFIILNN